MHLSVSRGKAVWSKGGAMTYPLSRLSTASIWGLSHSGACESNLRHPREHPQPLSLPFPSPLQALQLLTSAWSTALWLKTIEIPASGDLLAPSS